MFTNVIVRRPGKAVIDGITTADLGKPDYEKAIEQHDRYIDALRECGVEVTVLDADERYPDSCFVEDVAVLTKKCAIITNPGAKSRKGEEKEIVEILKKHYENIEYIQEPGTLEGGDVMMVGDHFYIGLSARTNEEGARQLINYLEKYGYTGSVVSLKEILHLKTGVTYIENNNLLISGEFIDNPIFKDFNKIVISDDDCYSVNCIYVNGHVIVPEGYEETKKAIEEAGYSVKVVDTLEFRKIDGGLTCLSLRF